MAFTPEQKRELRAQRKRARAADNELRGVKPQPLARSDAPRTPFYSVDQADSRDPQTSTLASSLPKLFPGVSAVRRPK